MNIAVITGATSGMGKEFTEQILPYYPDLSEIWCIARREDLLQIQKKKLEKRWKIKVHLFSGDLTDTDVVQHLSDEYKKKQPNIKVLVNAAGIGKNGRNDQISEKEQTQMVLLNCLALTKVTDCSIPYMKQGSCIYQLASAAAFLPQPGFCIYAATKAYVHSYAMGLQMELKEKGIHVVSICPGPVNTPFFEHAGACTNAFKKKCMADPKKVVKKALRDGVHHKPVSIYGFPIKGLKIMAKITPDVVLRKILTIFTK